MPFKILLVASSYLPNVGDLQTVASGLARELLRRGYGVQVITPRAPRTLPARQHIDRVLVRRWTFVAPRPGYLRRARLDLWLAGLAALPVTLARLLRHIARERPDVVNLQFAGSPALFVLLAHRLRPFRLVVSLHGDDVEGLPYRSALDRAVYRALLRRAGLVTACSRYLAEQAGLFAPEVAGRVRVVYNGLSPVALPPQGVAGHVQPTYTGLRPETSSAPAARDDDPLAPGRQMSQTGADLPPPAALDAGLFAVGRLVPKKGFDLLLRALAICANRTLSLTLCGDGPERDSLQALAHELHLDERVIFAGALPHHSVPSSMARSNLVVVPSRQEPFGLVALEAMQAGRPVVVSTAGGLPEVLAGADALLVSPADVAALAGAIDQALARLAAHPDYGARNRPLAARFSLDRMVDGYAQAYADVMGA